MTFGSLFAGIGGFDLGFERAGMTCKWQVEIDTFCRKVLEKHWPDVRRWDDVRTFPPEGDWHVDVICGGFPCQPVSNAGFQRGGKDQRWLWPEYIRVIREINPRWVVAENVPGLLTVDDGRLFGGILRDLAESRFDAEWSIVSACSMGAPHTRERLFIVAYPAGSRLEGHVFQALSQEAFDVSSEALDFWDMGWGPFIDVAECLAESKSVRVADGVSSTVDIRPRLHAYGNAVVPQVAEWIGRRLMQITSGHCGSSAPGTWKA